MSESHEATATRSAWYAHAMEQLVEVVQRLSMARDLPSVMEIVRHAARDLTGADGATFVLRDGDRCFYADEDAIEPLWKGQRFPMSACISGWVMLHREPAAISDIYADARIPADAYRPTFVQSLAMVPIRTLAPVGAIGNYWAVHHAPSADELRVLQALADTTAVAMENLRVYEELEARVAQRTAALQAILDNVEVGVFFSVGLAVERGNPKLAGILGLPSGTDPSGYTLRELLRQVDHVDAATFSAVLETGDAGARPFVAELQLRRFDESPFWARVAARTLEGGSQTRSTIWVVEDISESKAREDALDELRHTAEAATRFKSEFLASMSHELRTPLNAIMGFSEVLRDGLAGPLDARQIEYVSDIYDSGEHLLALINDVLDLSKIEAGKMSLDTEPVDMAQLLRGCLSIVKEKAMAHRIVLTARIPDTLGMAMLDPRKCKQIVYNLLSNAVKFTPDEGQVELRAAVVSRAQAFDAIAACDRVAQPMCDDGESLLLQLEVCDSGIGIDRADLRRLFEPFVQIDSSLSRQYQGSGLGLTLVRRLCALHGGTVGVRSSKGRGTTFGVWLPLLSVDAELETPDVQRAGPKDSMRPLALVVDDDAKAVGLMRVQLESAGCNVLVASSAEQAWDLLQEIRPCLIVLDVVLPGIDGWELLVRIKGHPGLEAIPVVVASIVADTGRGIALGAVDALQKPIPARLLRGVLRRLNLLNADGDACGSVVLVVDDDPQALEVVGSQLSTNGCTPLSAREGREALSMARAYRPNLIILDLLMPGMNGFEFMAALREEDTTADIPVVVLTAMDLDSAQRAALQAQACNVVQKSRFNEQRLLAIVRQAMSRR